MKFEEIENILKTSNPRDFLKYRRNYKQQEGVSLSHTDKMEFIRTSFKLYTKYYITMNP